METGLYTETRSHHDVKAADSATEALLMNTFSAPLPYVGSTLSGLKEHSLGGDQVAVRDKSYPHHYTAWNFQNRSVLTSFFTREPPANRTARQRTLTISPSRVHLTILTDGALAQVLRNDMCLSARDRTRLQSGQAWLSTDGQILHKLPKGVHFRSAPFTVHEALTIATRVGAPLPQVEEEFEILSSDINLPSSDSSSGSEPPVTVGPVEPTERSKLVKIPAKSVISRYASFQTSGPTTPPMSSLCEQMRALTTTTDKAATQPLLNTVRSPLARDLPSMQMLIAYSSASNGSYIDTAPPLRGLLYASAACPDMFDLDRTTNHFLRREDLTHNAIHAQHVHAWPAENRTAINVIAVTLPAYTNHLKGHDAALSAAGWSVQSMDQTWCAVPVSTDIVNSPFLLAYILCFVDTSVWAGRLCRRTQTQHVGEDGNNRNTHFTFIPHGHNVSISGPRGVMLVMLDESVTSRNSHVPMVRPEGMNVYPGSPYLQVLPNDLADYIDNVTDLLHDLMNNYQESALRMCHALEWIETNLCVDMAFQSAFSMAAELCNAIPESPTLEVGEDGAHRYNNPLNGAWTVGVHNFSADNPRHTSSDINAGPLVNRQESYTSKVCGYNWAMVSPLLQYQMSATNVVHEAVVEDNVVTGYNSHWETPALTEARPRYQCHAALSCYRIMAALGLIEKNDYSFAIKNRCAVCGVAGCCTHFVVESVHDK